MVCEPSPPMLMTASMPSLRALAMTVSEMSRTTSWPFSTVRYLKGIAPIGGAQNGAAARQNAADVLERELVGFLRPDQSVETIRNADDLPLVLQEGALDHGANDGVEAGSVASAGADADTANVRHCTVMVKGIAGDAVKSGSNVGGCAGGRGGKSRPRCRW